MSWRIRILALILLAGSLSAGRATAQTAGAGATPGGAAGVGASPGGGALPAAGSSPIAPAGSGAAGGVGSLPGSSPGGAVSPPNALNQPGGRETLQGPGIAAPAAQGTIGAPGVSGGLYGAGQSQLPPGEAASTVNQRPMSSGVDMPLTGQNARDESGAGGAAGSAAQTPFNPDEVRSLEQQTQQSPRSAEDRSQPGAVEGWRFRWHDDLWWYWTPERSWLVWQRDRWVPYERDALYARPAKTRSQARAQTAPAGSADAAASVPTALGEFRPSYMGAGLYSRAVNTTGRPEGTTAL
jgi:hypothetical protein